MPDPCGRTFDEALLSGYVDRVLTQGDEQRVRIHLDGCAVCRAVVSDTLAMREVTMSSSFDVPDDLQWSERPKGPASRFSFGLGWLLIALWGLGVLVRGAWAMRNAPWPSIEELIGFSAVLGIALLLLGVLLDRLRVRKTDRYREVQK